MIMEGVQSPIQSQMSTQIQQIRKNSFKERVGGIFRLSKYNLMFVCVHCAQEFLNLAHFTVHIEDHLLELYDSSQVNDEIQYDDSTNLHCNESSDRRIKQTVGYNDQFFVITEIEDGNNDRITNIPPEPIVSPPDLHDEEIKNQTEKKCNQKRKRETADDDYNADIREPSTSYSIESPNDVEQQLQCETGAADVGKLVHENETIQEDLVSPMETDADATETILIDDTIHRHDKSAKGDNIKSDDDSYVMVYVVNDVDENEPIDNGENQPIDDENQRTEDNGKNQVNDDDPIQTTDENGENLVNRVKNENSSNIIGISENQSALNIDGVDETDEKKLEYITVDIDNESFLTPQTSAESKPETVHDAKRPFQCQICDKNYTLKRSLKRHLYTHFDGYECKECGKNFTYSIKLRAHYRQMHPDVEFFHDCSECGSKFKHEYELNIHLKDDHNIETDIFKAIPVLKLIGRRDLNLHCHLCPLAFATKYDIMQHFQTEHGIPKDQIRGKTCFYCNKYFQKADAEYQFRMHTCQRSYQCEQCGKQFCSVQTLSGHMLCHSDERKIICDICSKAFKTKHQLTMHMRGHTGNYIYNCKICKKGFSEKRSLKKHMPNAHEIPWNAEAHDVVRSRHRKV